MRVVVRMRSAVSHAVAVSHAKGGAACEWQYRMRNAVLHANSGIPGAWQDHMLTVDRMQLSISHAVAVSHAVIGIACTRPGRMRHRDRMRNAVSHANNRHHMRMAVLHGDSACGNGCIVCARRWACHSVIACAWLYGTLKLSDFVVFAFDKEHQTTGIIAAYLRAKLSLRPHTERSLELRQLLLQVDVLLAQLAQDYAHFVLR